MKNYDLTKLHRINLFLHSLELRLDELLDEGGHVSGRYFLTDDEFNVVALQFMEDGQFNIDAIHPTEEEPGIWVNDFVTIVDDGHHTLDDALANKIIKAAEAALKLWKE